MVSICPRDRRVRGPRYVLSKCCWCVELAVRLLRDDHAAGGTGILFVVKSKSLCMAFIFRGGLDVQLPVVGFAFE
jgi:hypothetical protein